MAPKTVKEVFDGMPQALNAEKAAGKDLVFQFDITGDEAGQWVVAIKDGACTVTEGTTDNPTTTFILDGQNWVKMVTGELSGTKAFMTGKLKLKGDIMAAQNLAGLFKMA